MPRSLLDRQLARVRRRLFLATLLACLAWCWLGAVALAAAWVVARPFLVPTAPEALRWFVLVGLGMSATIVAVVVAARRAPSAVAAALALDDRFGLKERVTTSLSLSPEEAGTPAGRALLADVEGKLAVVRVGERFSVRLPRLAASLLPLGVAGLVLLMLYWNPRVGAGADADDPDAAPLAKEDVEQKMKQLATRPKAKQAAEPVKAEELERIDREIEKFTRSPRDTREEVRDRVKDATTLEEQIRREQKQHADRIDAFKEAMKQAERLKRKNRDKKEDGPAKNAADALARFDMDQAENELKRLARRMDKEDEKERLRGKKDGPKATEEERKKAEEELDQLDREDNLTQKEHESLQKQLEQLEDMLKQMAKNKDEKEKDLRDLAEKGEIDREQLERELAELAKNEEQLGEQEKKDAEELAKELGECKNCMKEGKNGEAARKLQKAAEKAGQMGKGEQDKELARRLAQVQQVKRALCRQLGGGVGAGRRPEKDGETAHKDAVVPPDEREKGKTEVIGQGPFGGFKGPRKPADLQAEIKQAAQEAPAAIDRQRLPPSARKMARDYFEKVRGPEKDGNKK